MVLIEFTRNRWGQVSAKSLLNCQDLDWGTAGEENVKDVIVAVRAALRKVISDAGVNVHSTDPIPCIDKGSNLSWKLQMP
jgi:hypothetical protein